MAAAYYDLNSPEKGPEHMLKLSQPVLLYLLQEFIHNTVQIDLWMPTRAKKGNLPAQSCYRNHGRHEIAGKVLYCDTLRHFRVTPYCEKETYGSFMLPWSGEQERAVGHNAAAVT